MTAKAIIPTPATDLVDALDDLAQVVAGALGQRCLMCRASTDGPARDIDAEQLELALTRVRRTLRVYRRSTPEDLNASH
jgi:hypothetical protein